MPATLNELKFIPRSGTIQLAQFGELAHDRQLFEIRDLDLDDVRVRPVAAKPTEPQRHPRRRTALVLVVHHDACPGTRQGGEGIGLRSGQARTISRPCDPDDQQGHQAQDR